ncbi:MAG: penicillin-binding protein activator [bacterium]|nr:penicillin-binding protein activator [bacterium]
MLKSSCKSRLLAREIFPVLGLGLAFYLAAVALGCGPKMVIRDGRRIPMEVAAKMDFAQAEAKFQLKDWAKSYPEFEHILGTYPESKLADQAFFRMGEIRLNEKNYPEALTLFVEFVRKFPMSDLTRNALIRQALCYHQLGREQETVSILSETRESVDEKERSTLDYILAQGYEKLGRSDQALLFYQKALPYLEGDKADEVRKKGVDIIRNKLSEDELERILNDLIPEYFLAEALIELAHRKIDRQDWKGADKLLADELGSTKAFYRRGEVESFLANIKDWNAANPNRIGLIVPLSGRYQPFGEQALKGVLLAAGVFGGDSPQGGTFQVVIQDAESDPQAATRAVENLVLRDHVLAIVGPLLSPTSEAASRRAEVLKIPLISLSQKEDLTKSRRYVFRLGLTHSQQVESLVAYAMDTLGMRKFAILYPKDSYGEDFIFRFWDEVKKRGGEIRGVEGYDPKSTDFGDQIKALAGISEPNQDEVKLFEKAGIELTPIVDFDAVFIPDSYRNGGLIAPQLAYYGVTDVKILGTGSFNHPDYLRLGKPYVNGTILADGFFRESGRPATREFYQKYQGAYGEDPTLISAQAFDVTRLLITLSRHFGVKDRESLRESLLGVEGFPGATGNIKSSPNGELIRPLFLLTVTGDEFEEIE